MGSAEGDLMNGTNGRQTDSTFELKSAADFTLRSRGRCKSYEMVECAKCFKCIQMPFSIHITFIKQTYQQQ